MRSRFAAERTLHFIALGAAVVDDFRGEQITKSASVQYARSVRFKQREELREKLAHEQIVILGAKRSDGDAAVFQQGDSLPGEQNGVQVARGGKLSLQVATTALRSPVGSVGVGDDNLDADVQVRIPGVKLEDRVCAGNLFDESVVPPGKMTRVVGEKKLYAVERPYAPQKVCVLERQLLGVDNLSPNFLVPVDMLEDARFLGVEDERAAGDGFAGTRLSAQTKFCHVRFGRLFDV